jgi:ABC-type glycerol-3-phosphate transport system permease component
VTPVQWVLTAGLCAIAVVFLHPLYWLADSAFRRAIYIFQVPPILFQHPVDAVRDYTLYPMREALVRWGAGKAFLDSVIVTVLGVGLALLVSSLCAYAFAFLRFRGRDALFFGLLGLMMIPMATMMVPLVKTMRVLNLVDTLAGVILPYAMTPMGVFLLRQYYIKIPREIFEAARIDGAGHAWIWWSLVVPLSRPALATLATFHFLYVWNDFLLPVLVLRSERFVTLPLKVAVMRSMQYVQPYEAIMACGFIAAIVPLALFLRFQKQFIQGLMGGYGK